MYAHGTECRVSFSKYHGLGNDFIMIDNRDGLYDSVIGSQTVRHAMCSRRTGIGADGIVEMRSARAASSQSAVSMEYYNADGRLGSLCGNGSRCFVAFALQQGILGEGGLLDFEACDGRHKGWYNHKTGLIRIKMSDISSIRCYENGDYFLDSGSPHHVRFVENTNNCDVINLGREIRKSQLYDPVGANVNFVASVDGRIHVRTYERGVEDETLACGTGIIAALVIHHFKHYRSQESVSVDREVMTLGGSARVKFTRREDQSFTDIYLTGPACHVYDGEYQVK